MRILIVKLSSMGDVIHTLPAITDLANLYPDIAVDWVVEKSFAEIPKWHFAVKKVIPINLRYWLKFPIKMLRHFEVKDFYQELRENKYDFVIDAQGLFKSALVAWLARGVACGLDFNSSKERFASFLYKNKFAIAKNQHAIIRIRQLFAKALDYKIPESHPDYGIFTDHLAKVNNCAKYVLFIHSASRQEKLWPEKNWIVLANKIIAVGFKVQLLWGNETERMRAIQIKNNCPNIIILPKLTLTEIVAVLRGASGVVAVDTGLGHLAAALSVPTISLYGPTNPSLVGTYGANQLHMALTSSAQEVLELSLAIIQ